MNGQLLWGDNLTILQQIPDNIADMVYIDPPFFSNKDYKTYNKTDGSLSAFSDTWKGGLTDYLQWLHTRIKEVYRCLKPDATLFLHCDWHADAYIRTQILDPIFGTKQLLNVIALCYNMGGRSSNCFARKKDTIFWYAKGKQWTFCADAIKIPMDSGTKSFGGKLLTDADGRVYREVFGSKNSKGEKRYYRYYLDEGKVPEDWWIDINSLQASHSERCDYPTQKPEALLERIILASTQKGAVIIDPFVGSGTSVVVAERWQRQWIGIDCSEAAIQTTSMRLKALSADFRCSSTYTSPSAT